MPGEENLIHIMKANYSNFSLSVVMPTFNEAGNIAALIKKTLSVLSTSGFKKIEIVVVDDNSPDGTGQIVEKIMKTDSRVRLIKRLKNHGLTPSLREGISKAKNNVIVWMDCDFSHPPEKIPQMLFMLGQGYDICVNSRYVVGGGEDRVGKGNLMQMTLSLVLNWTLRFILFSSFADYTSGFIAVKRKVFSNIRLRGDYGEYFISLVYDALRAGFNVCELPYFCAPRKSGESKTGSNLLDYMRRGKKYLMTALKCRIFSSFK